MKRTLRYTLIALGAVLAALLVALGGGYLYLQSEAGKRALEDMVARALSSPEGSVTIEGLGGSVPFDLTAARITVSDRTGPWLEIDNVHLEIDGAALWHRELAIRQLTVSSVAVARAPETTAEPKSSTAIDLSLPKLPVTVRLDHLAIDHVALAEPVLGQPATLTFSGQGALGGDEADLHLDLARTDDTPGRASLAMTLTGKPAVLDLKLDVSEPTGLLMARLLGREAPQPLTVALAGTGPLSAWQGKLTGNVGEILSVESDLGLKQDDGLHLSLDGSVTQHGLVPDSLQPILGERIAFAADAGLRDDVVTLDNLTVTAAALDVTGSARLDNASQAVTGSAQVSLPDLKAAESLLGVALAGRGQLDLKVEGSTAEPVLQATLTGDGIDAQGFGVGQLDATFALKPNGPIDDEKTAWQIDAGGHVAGITQAGQALPAGLGDAIDWSLSGLAAPAEQSFALDHLSAKGAGLDLAAKGQVSPEAAAGSLSLKVAELAAFGDLVRLPRMHGKLSVDADVTTDADGHVTAAIKGGAEDLSIGIQVVDAIVGPTVSIVAKAERRTDGKIALSDLDVVTVAATLTGNVEYAPDSDAVTGRIVMRMPKLDPLTPAIRISIRGDATLTADLGGSLERPSMQAVLEGRNLDIEYAPVRKVTAQISVDDLNEPSGRISAVFDLAGVPGKLDTGFAMPPNDFLNLRKLVLTAGGGRLAGDIDYDLEHDLASGKLAGTLPDLQPWSVAAGMALSGSAETAITLVPRDGQIADVKVAGSDIKIGAAKDAVLLSQLEIDGHGRNIMNDPAGTATLDVTGIGARNLRFDQAHLEADVKSDSEIGFSGQAGGEMMLGPEGDQQRRLPLTLDLAGDWSEGKDGQSITLSRFAGKLDQDEAKLLQPVTLAMGVVETRLLGLDLDLAGGRIGGYATLGKDRIMLKLTGQKLPLAVAGHFLARPLTGTLDMAADLEGTLAAPGGKVTIAGKAIRITDAEASSIPPLDFDLSLVPGGGQVAIDGQASMPSAKLLTVTGHVPLDLTASSPIDMIPAQRPMLLKLDGDGQLQGLVELLALGEDRLSGHYTVALTLAGTRAAPEAGGQVSLSEGRYLNQAFGTELHDIAATLEGDQTRLTLTHFSAQDGLGGSLTASGSIDLAALPAPLLDLKATLANLRVANSDTARVTANGDVALGGSVAEPALTAHITIPRAEFRIPDRLPPNVRTLDVIVIDSRDPHATAQQLADARRRAAQPSPRLRVALDVTVSIPGQSFLRGHGLESEWRGRISMSGNSSAPVIGGKLQTVRGTMDFLGKSFVIRRGVITFPTGRVTEPQLDVQAEYSANDIVAQVMLTGSPTAPNLVLTSRPTLPQDEILSRVLFGEDTSRITPAQGAQLALAANNLASGGPGILDRLREGIGLDRLDFGSASTNPAAPPPRHTNGSSSGSGEDAGPMVSGGKYIAPGVFVGVSQGTTADTSSARVEVDITRGLTGYSSVGAVSSQVGLDWRMDY
ncbi:translocation/assembly module TamB [Hypericibacter terrae]|uniref:Translocation/assembly module TamB n=1 Tax=Hypericibacter terrae TaxID=2602015 RepID=A0A5J6MG83_9PROT|nr:translocation/assembly module TamB domain-containing protein [Hypericibacter terrae]QEX16504.1 translocation/assembly module TamB [Hypericibacter terrae]